jgi:16S rRNA (guanine966-N2)-methyltransferase
MKMKTKKPVSAQRAAHQVRIIGGQWKRSLLSVIEAEGLRPTPDRVRETAFNWIHHLCDGNWAQMSVLDMFAGSGALGFEAASRGAKELVMLEMHTPAYQQLLRIQDKLAASQCRILRADAARMLNLWATEGQKFDLIFLDPPFGQDWLQKILPVCEQILKPSALVYVESEYPLDKLSEDENMRTLLSGWEVLRADKAGSVYFHILQRNI